MHPRLWDAHSRFNGYGPMDATNQPGKQYSRDARGRAGWPWGGRVAPVSSGHGAARAGARENFDNISLCSSVVGWR